MRVFWVLRDLYKRLFSRGAGSRGGLSSEAAVRDALKKKLELRSEVRALRERAALAREQEERERKVWEEGEMLKELRRTRARFSQTIEHVKKEREKNAQMIEENAKSRGKHETREEKLKRVFEEIEKFEDDFFKPTSKS